MVVNGEPHTSYTLTKYELPIVKPVALNITVPENVSSHSKNVPSQVSNISITGKKSPDPVTWIVGSVVVATNEYHTSLAMPPPQYGHNDSVAPSISPAVVIQLSFCVKDIAPAHSSLAGACAKE